MPLYEYKCRQCSKIFEALQRFSDDPLKVHEECGGEVDRLISAPAFHLKGTGWYATDYAKKNGADGKPTESKPKSEGEKTETKTGGDSTSDSSSSPAADSKPAASATETKPAAKSE